MSTFFKLSVLSILCMLLWTHIPAYAMPENASSDYPQATVSSTNKLNIRSGPNKTYGVVGQLMPSEVVRVISIDNASDGWIEICTQSGVKGYVAQSYLSGTYITDLGKTDTKVTYYDSYSDSPFFVHWYLSLYLYIFDLSSTFSLALLLFICGIEVFLIIWLKRIYHFEGTSPVTAYVVLAVSTILTLPGVFIYSSALQRGSWGIIVYVLMLLSTGCLMLHSAWRIKLCGMHLGRQRNYDSNNYQIGRWLGNILWLALLIPFAKIWWNICDVDFNNVYHISNGFFIMLFTLCCMTALNLLISKLVWPRVVVRYLFHVANQGVVYIMSLVFIWGIMSYEYKVLKYGLYGINFVFGIILIIFLGILTFGLVINTINECRCANCHSYNTDQTGLTDLGNVSRISTKWESISDSSVNRRYRDSIVSDPKRQVRTTEIVSLWKTHHTCFDCSNSWDMDHEETVGSSSRTLKKEWTEYS